MKGVENIDITITIITIGGTAKKIKISSNAGVSKLIDNTIEEDSYLKEHQRLITKGLWLRSGTLSEHHISNGSTLYYELRADPIRHTILGIGAILTVSSLACAAKVLSTGPSITLQPRFTLHLQALTP